MAGTARTSWMEAWERDLVPSEAACRSAARAEVRSRSTRYYGREATAKKVRQAEPEIHSARPLPELKIVRRRKPRWGALVIVMTFALLMLGVAVVAPMLVSSATRDVESAVGRLETRQQQLAAGASELAAQVSTLSSPERIVEQAIRLGLVPAQSVQYLQAGSGTAAAEGDTAVAGR